MKTYMTIQEVAEHVRLSVPKLYRLTMEHRIPCFKIGTRLVFDPEKIEEWVESHAVEPDEGRVYRFMREGA